MEMACVAEPKGLPEIIARVEHNHLPRERVEDGVPTEAQRAADVLQSVWES